MNTLQHAIDDYLVHLRFIRQLSPCTVKAYQRDLQYLADYVSEISLGNISTLVIRRLIAGNNRLHPASIARLLSAWRTFFDYLVNKGDIANNPVVGVTAPKKKASLPKSLTPDEVNAVLSPKTKQNWLFLRDTAIIELLYSSALRLSELVSLDVNDVDLDAGIVTIKKGKGGQGRVVPIGKTAKNTLEKWLVCRNDLLKQHSQSALFISRRLSRLAPRSIQQQIDYRQKSLGLAKNISPHVFRHSCASHFLQSSGDLRATQELLGHKSISSTQIYTRLDFQHLARVYDRAHPRANIKKEK